MREIKFRVWNKRLNAWVYKTNINESDSDWSENDKNTIGQFTGLLDKNGKEIYDGDIVAFEDKWEWYRGTFPEWWAMTNEERKSWIDKQPTYSYVIEYNATEGYSYDLSNHYAIIGNIHDNPELLEKGK